MCVAGCTVGILAQAYAYTKFSFARNSWWGLTSNGLLPGPIGRLVRGGNLARRRRRPGHGTSQGFLEEVDLPAWFRVCDMVKN